MRMTQARVFGSITVIATMASAVLGDRIEFLDLQTLTPAHLSLSDCTAVVARAQDQAVLDVHFGQRADWPNVKFDVVKAYTQQDWAEASALVVDLENRQPEPVGLSIRVDDAVEADGHRHCRQGGVTLAGRQRALVRFDLAVQKIEGMRGQPRLRGGGGSGLWIQDNGRPIDLSHIVAFQIFRARPDEEAAVRIHGIWLEKQSDTQALRPFVDRFGQFTEETWALKLNDEAEFAERHQTELQDLEAHPPPDNQNRFGGWREGPQLEATGRFRVQKVDGKWWFVDPEGRLFWSAGITGLRAESGGPMLGREACFSWLPQEGDPLKAFYRTQGRGWIDFFAMNLTRKYGEDFEQAFAEISARRLRSWGLNTVGNWSDARVWKLGKVPYTIPVHYGCPSIPMWTHRSFPDVFAEEFEQALRARLDSLAEYRDDPWLLGVFIDNELPWAGWGAQSYLLPVTLLKSETATETRRVLVGELEETYGSIARLNESWGCAAGGWQDLRDGFELDANQQKRAQSDLSAMSTRIARQYFSTCRRLMDELMPGCLYLGPRFSSFNRESVAVAKKFCDVVCFNIYAERPTDGGRADIARELDIPVVIGEYHFGALDSGMFHTGLRKAANQQERAEKFGNYLRIALREPWCVGAHWFQFRDQPLTGRFDGENYNIGFVTITDTPYPLMRQTARNVTLTMYPFRAEN